MFWVQGQYVRRSGYWLAAQPDWVWVPSHYVATPRGYIFAEGHWDYSLDRRGVLFAPLCFPASVYGRAGIIFSPSVVIDVGLLRVSLFAYPLYSHYYFGDYYDDAYLSIGIYPWFDCHRLHTWYDPVYEHDRWRNQRSEPRWEQHEREGYTRRRGDRDLRPARTFREQEARLAKMPEPQRRAMQLTQPIAVAAAQHDKPLNYERINSASRQKISTQAAAVRTYRDERTRWESASARPKITPPLGERKTGVALPTERREQAPPVTGKERDNAAMPPAERKQTAQPPDRGVREGPVTAPASHKDVQAPVPQKTAAIAPAHEARASQPDRVQIPASPVVGKSGSAGIFEKGPPKRPPNEGRDKGGKDDRRK
jgi:hypothetical protein